jgi:hypothetical protein
MCFEPPLQAREIERERPFGQRFALDLLFLIGKKKGARELGVDVLHRLHYLVAKSGLPCVCRIQISELTHIAIDGIRL